jgi:hypothetical protein
MQWWHHVRTGHRWLMLFSLLVVVTTLFAWMSPRRQAAIQPPQANAMENSPRCAPPGQATGASTAQTTVDMCVLVISANGKEDDLPAITQALEYLGTPYALYVARDAPGKLTASTLFNGQHAFYQGVILATDSVAYQQGNNYVSSLSPQEWQALNGFEARFHLRQITWYTYPSTELGYQSAVTGLDTTHSPVSASFTEAARSIFPYVNTATPLAIQNTYAYLAQPLSGPNTVPLLVDSAGNALAVVQTYSDGRQNLSMTFDSGRSAIYSVVLDEGLVSWVTQGLFLGERHIYLTPEIDDLFLPDRERVTSLACSPTETTSSSADFPPDNSTTGYRITGSDLQNVAKWESALNAQPMTRQLRLTFAFNGFRAVPQNPSSDSLTSAVLRLKNQFYFVSHTYGHVLMKGMDYSTAYSELQRNIAVARQLGLTTFSPTDLVTPEISGLDNPQVLRAAHDVGIRFVVSDTSRKGYDNPSPNAGILNQYQPSILMVPRYPTNLGYDVSTPAEWVKEYNCTFGAYLGRSLTYSEILDRESQTILSYMLAGDMDPIAFHQTNLRAYDGQHTLLLDLLDAVLAKYRSLYNLPVESLNLNVLGQRMLARMQYNAAGVTATLVPGQHITLTVRQAATVPVTGLRSAGAEFYGGQYISYIHLNAGQSVTLPLR